MREQLLRLMMSNLDFRHALSAATFLAEECEWAQKYRTEELRRFKCYETTMVVAYGRPFAQSRAQTTPFRWSLLGPKFKLLAAEKTLHEKMIEFRNRLHAHSDGDFTQISPEIWRTPMPEGRSFDFLAMPGGEGLNFQKEEIEAIHSFLWKLRHHVEEAVQNHPAPRDEIPVRIVRID